MSHKKDLSFLANRLKAFTDTGAWLLIIFGILIFASRIPFQADGIVNLPVAVTVLQTAGLMFAIAGLQIMISRMVWPGISVSSTLREIQEGSTASALLMCGLLFYNGITTVAFVMWLSSALGAGLGAR